MALVKSGSTGSSAVAALLAAGVILLSGCGGGSDSSTSIPEPPAAPTWSSWTAQTLPSALASFNPVTSFSAADGKAGLLVITTRSGGSNAATPFLVEGWRLRVDGVWSGPVALGHAASGALDAATGIDDGLVVRVSDALRRWNAQSETWESIAPPPQVTPGGGTYNFSTMANGRLLATTIRGTPTTASTVDLFVLSNTQWVALKSLTVPADTGPERFTDAPPLVWTWAKAYESDAGTLVRVAWGAETTPPAQSLPKYAAEFVATGSPATTQTHGSSCLVQASVGCIVDHRVLRNGAIAYWSNPSRFPSIGLVSKGTQFSMQELTSYTSRFWSGYTAFANANDGELFLKGSCDTRFAFCEGNVGVVWINPATLAPRESAGAFPQAMTTNGSMVIVRDPASIGGSTLGNWMISSRLRRAEFTEPVAIPLNANDSPLQVIEAGANDQYATASADSTGLLKIVGRKRR